jgi:ABC-type sugar transport system ATPase subunit
VELVGIGKELRQHHGVARRQYRGARRGEYRVDGTPVQFASPREALDRGIATVYQDLAVVPLMPVWRNFFLGSEPTAALGVKQSGVVLKYVAAARDAGLGVKLITHNPHHAFMVGDHFIVLRQGEIELNATRRELTLDDLTHHMAGGAELESLKHELNRLPAPEMGALQKVSPTG